MCAYADERWEDLCAAVAALQRQTLPPLETIVVIDHNPALAARARVALTEARVIEASDGRRGLSGARNAGIDAARGEIVAFLDDDAVPEPGWLEALAEAHEDPDVLGAGGVASPLWEVMSAPRWLPREFWWTIGCSYRGLPERVAPVRNPIGATMSFRRELLEQLGGFTDGIGRVGRTPLGCEETELSIRARRAHPSGVVLHVPAARVAHRVPAARATWRYFRSRCWAEGLSKALVRASVGSEDALSSERAYTLRTLPSGIAHGIRDALRGDGAGLLRSGAIVAGFSITVAGYLRGLLARSR